MKSAFVFALALCFAVSALSVPSATDAPAEEFDKNATTTTTTTITTPTTTKSTTATTTKSTTPTTTKSTTATTTPTTTKSTTPTTTPTTTKSTTPTTTPTTTKSTTPTTTKSTTPTTTPTTTKPTTPAPPKPTPPANLTVGNYTVKSDKTVICLMAQMALQIRLVTPKENGTFIVQPQEKMTTVEGFCKGAKANLTLVFKEGFITFMFNKTATDVYVDALSLSLSYPLTKDGHMPYIAKNNSMHLFAAKVGHSYSCKSDSVYLGNGLSLEVTQDRMQAFNLTKSNEFGSPEPCPADRPDYRVAIAVGVTLLVLIVIVVVAYLLGRRRRADGYQSL